MPVYKVYLAPDVWQQVCSRNPDVTTEVAKQQPEMFATIAAGIEVERLASTECPASVCYDHPPAPPAPETEVEPEAPPATVDPPAKSTKGKRRK